METKHVALRCAAAGALLLGASRALAHGYVGDRFFPPTISTDDPFAVDELALPTVSVVKNSGDGPSSWEWDSGFEFDKEIFPHFAIGISDTYIYQHFRHLPTAQGWDNLALTAKYELWQNDEHEAIIAVGLESDIGGTGSRGVGRVSFTTLTPKLFVGKGFPEFGDRLWPLQPFAVTGEVGQSFPTSAADPNALEWGFAVEYSLPYLQGHVKDIGLPKPFADMIPLVEFSMESTENRGQGGLTTGTINPGVLWESNYFQLGVEANIPINRASGSHVGATIQMWIFIDDLFPKIFGHPVFGERS